jgi:hypothetical protein
MIDRTARDALSEAIRALVSGSISNVEFEDRVPRRSRDPAVYEVFFCGAWSLYDDLHEHRLVGKYHLPSKARPEIARWILFLKSDYEYEWPLATGFVGSLWILCTLVSLGTLLPLRRYLYRRGGALRANMR